MSQKWEYRQEIFQGVDVMNGWGAEGWELAGFFGKDGAFMILKRPVAQKRMAKVAPAEPTPRAGSRSGSSSSGGRPSSRSGGGGGGANKGKFKEMI